MLKELLKNIFLPFILLLCLWLVFTRAGLDALPVGIAAASAGALATLIFKKKQAALNIAGAARFIPFFIHQSIEGGFDVARRALHPAMPIDPGLIRYRVSLPHGPAHIFFSAMISLLPGTLTSRIDGSCLVIHVLDQNQPLQQKLRQLEVIVARMFSIDIKWDSEACI